MNAAGSAFGTSRHLPVIVNGVAAAAATAGKRGQLMHPGRARPDESVRKATRDIRVTDHLSETVDAERQAIASAGQRAQVLHSQSLAPDHGVRLKTRAVRGA